MSLERNVRPTLAGLCTVNKHTPNKEDLMMHSGHVQLLMSIKLLLPVMTVISVADVVRMMSTIPGQSLIPNKGPATSLALLLHGRGHCFQDEDDWDLREAI